MLFIELNVPSGTFTVDERRDLAMRLTAGRLLRSDESEPGAADPGVIELYESLTTVSVREHDVWVSAGAPVADGLAHIVVNVYVGAWAKEIAEHLSAQITDHTIAFAAERDPESAPPRVRVHVIGIPDGQYALDGTVVTSARFLEMIEQAKRPLAQAPENTFIDPVCGAIIDADAAYTLERGGVQYGFCCPHCRGHYAKQLDRDSESV